jgi:hypothetical protein
MAGPVRRFAIACTDGTAPLLTKRLQKKFPPMAASGCSAYKCIRRADCGTPSMQCQKVNEVNLAARAGF